MSATLERVGVAAELEQLVDLVEGLALCESEGRLVLAPARGEPVGFRFEEGALELEFCGWREWFVGDEDPEDALASALDFVAAAMFGELRVVELHLDERVLQRVLECRVDGRWRRHARRGRLGLVGIRARIARRLGRRVRVNAGLVARPPALGEARPRGLPSAPWMGAAHGVSSEAAQAELEIDGELDLHNFSPKEVAPLVREYIEVCRQRGIVDLRIVHGKGKGVLRRTVHSLLDKHPEVERYRLGGSGEGSWGATIVRLRAPRT